MTPKVMIGWTDGGGMNSRFGKSLLDLQRFELEQAVDSYKLIDIDHATGLYVPENRNQLVLMARERGADWLLQLDADLSFPPVLLRILMRIADPVARPIVVGLYANIGTAHADGMFDVVNMVYGEAPDGQYAPLAPPKTMQPFRVDAAGSGILLTHLSVFEKIQPPWFWLGLFKRPDGGLQTMNEDIAFCRMAREAGLEIWCDPAAEGVHWKTLPMRSSQFRDMYEAAQAQARQMKEERG